MTGQTNRILAPEAAARGVRASGLNETLWGYVIRPGDRTITRAAYGEMVATFIGILLGMAAYGQWLLPGSINDIDMLPIKIGSTVILFTVGALLYFMSRRGMCPEFQVDLQRRQIRRAVRNRRGIPTQTEVLDFSALDGAFLRRTKSAFIPDRLYVRRAKQSLIEVSSGREVDLAPILKRLIEDLRPPVAKPVKFRPVVVTGGARVRNVSVFGSRVR
jgi:hypothetical protein